MRTLVELEAFLDEEDRKVRADFALAETMPHGEERQVVWRRARHGMDRVGRRRHSLRFIKGEVVTVFETHWGRKDWERLHDMDLEWVLYLPLDRTGGCPVF